MVFQNFAPPSTDELGLLGAKRVIYYSSTTKLKKVWRFWDPESKMSKFYRDFRKIYFNMEGIGILPV